MIGAAVAMMYAAIATSTGALAFLTGQRSSGRTSEDVRESYEKAALLEGVARELRELCEKVEKDESAGEGREDLVRARDRLDDAIAGLQRGADLVV